MYYPPPTTYPIPVAARPAKRRVIGVLVAALIIAALIGGVVYHATGATRTVANFYHAVFVDFNASEAYAHFCTQPPLSDISGLQNKLTYYKSLATFDLTQLTYVVTDEDFFGTTHIQLGGSITITTLADGSRQTKPLPTESTSRIILTLRPSGIGWCIASTYNLILADE